MDKIENQCRLCNTTESGMVNIFKDVLNSEGYTYALQIQEMFQLALADTPDWPTGCCSGCAEFMERMKRFKQSIIERHCALDKIYRVITINKGTEIVQEATENPPEHPMESVFFVEDPVGKTEERISSEVVLIDDEDLDEPTESQVGDYVVTEGVTDEQKVVTIDDEEEVPRPNARRKYKRVAHRCKLCEVYLRSAFDLANHIRLKHKKRKVRTTPALTDEQKNLEAVMRERDLLRCHICAEKVDDYLSLSQHYRSEHKKDEGVYCCDRFYCRRVIAFDHMRYHQDPDTFKCLECDKRFRNSDRLAFHNEFYHSGRAGIVCKTCGRSFRHEKSYQKHVSTVHISQEDMKHKCSYCGKAFSWSGNLSRHISRMHEKVLSHVCNVCGKAFTDPEYLDQHVKRHSVEPSTGEKKISLLLRGRKKMETSTVRKDRKLEQCDICENYYVNVHHHKTTIHRVVREPKFRMGKGRIFCDKCGQYVAKLSFRGHNSICGKSKGGPMKCTLCDKIFAGIRHLKLHTHYAHNKKRETACPFCDFKSVSKGNRLRHFRYSHPEEYERCKGKAIDESGEPQHQYQSEVDDDDGQEGSIVIEEGSMFDI